MSLVQRAFNKAASQYFNACYGLTKASLQQQTAALLLAQLEASETSEINQLLDLGCGMGVHWARLKSACHHYLGIDLAPEMIRQARQHIGQPLGTEWQVGDAQALQLESDSINVVFSNLALQWCASQQRVANELFRVCKQGGEVHFTTLTTGSLKELQALKQLGLLRTVNEYPSAASWQEALRLAGFKQIDIRDKTLTTYHANGAALLRSMKNIGATQRTSKTTVDQGLRTANWLKQVQSQLEQYRQPQGIPLTHQVAMVKAIK